MSEPASICPECGTRVPMSSAVGPPGLRDLVCPNGHRFGPGVDAERRRRPTPDHERCNDGGCRFCAHDERPGPQAGAPARSESRGQRSTVADSGRRDECPAAEDATLDVAYELTSVTQDLWELQLGLRAMGANPTVVEWCGYQAGRIQRAVDELVRAALIRQVPPSRARRGRHPVTRHGGLSTHG